MIVSPEFVRIIYNQQENELMRQIEWNRRIKKDRLLQSASYRPQRSWIGKRWVEWISHPRTQKPSVKESSCSTC